MADPEKGKFSADIGQDVIDQALRSVQRSGAAPEVAVEVDAAAGAAASDAGTPDAVTVEAPAEPPEVAELRAQLELSLAKGREMMEKIRDSHEKMLRAAADLENFKKRAHKEKEEVQKFGIERLLKDFLPVVDNLDRALEAARSGTDYEALRTGVQMTRKLFEDTLGRHGVKGFSAKGKPFDPRLHEAMQQLETAEMPPNHVAAEVLRGYTLNDRLVRPALVMVSKAKEAPPAAAAPPETAAGSGSASGAAEGNAGQKSEVGE